MGSVAGKKLSMESAQLFQQSPLTPQEVREVAKITGQSADIASKIVVKKGGLNVWSRTFKHPNQILPAGSKVA